MFHGLEQVLKRKWISRNGNEIQSPYEILIMINSLKFIYEMRNLFIYLLCSITSTKK